MQHMKRKHRKANNKSIKIKMRYPYPLIIGSMYNVNQTDYTVIAVHKVEGDVSTRQIYEIELADTEHIYPQADYSTINNWEAPDED